MLARWYTPPLRERTGVVASPHDGEDLALLLRVGAARRAQGVEARVDDLDGQRRVGGRRLVLDLHTRAEPLLAACDLEVGEPVLHEVERQEPQSLDPARLPSHRPPLEDVRPRI